MSAPVEAIAWRTLAPQRWKNGAGTTREIAISPPGAGSDDFDWRISVAEIARDALFSAYPGVDRCIVLLRGDGMRLNSVAAGIDQRLERPHEPFHFAGDDALQASLLGGPSEDLNVMVRRGRYQAEVTSHSGTVDVAPADAGLLLCSEGVWFVDESGAAAPTALQPLHALLWRHQMPQLQARPAAAHGHLLVVRLDALCQDDAA